MAAISSDVAADGAPQWNLRLTGGRLETLREEVIGQIPPWLYNRSARAIAVRLGAVGLPVLVPTELPGTAASLQKQIQAVR